MKLADNVLITNMSGKIVLSKRNDPEGNNICIFNDIGQWIVKHIIDGNTEEQMIKELSEGTLEEQETIKRDLGIFLKEMIDAGYLKK